MARATVKRPTAGRDETPETNEMFPEGGEEQEEMGQGAKPAAYGPSPTTAAPPAGGPDPFDPESYRYDPQNMEGLVQRVWTEGQIQVRKPDDQEWFRARPGEEWQLAAAILLLKPDRKFRLIAPAIAPAVRAAKPMVLRTCVTIGGRPYPVARSPSRP